MQNQQLLPKGEVLEEEFSSRAKGGDNPAEQTSKTQHKFSLGTAIPACGSPKLKSSPVSRILSVVCRDPAVIVRVALPARRYVIILPKLSRWLGVDLQDSRFAEDHRSFPCDLANALLSGCSQGAPRYFITKPLDRLRFH